MRESLASERRAAVQRSAEQLLAALTRALGVPAVSARVLTVRPSSATSELHGLYVQEANRRAVITVWMRTASHKRTVAFRTFLRTVVHELCHHLDYQLYGLAESFHTEGFFRRESSLMRQLAPKAIAMPRAQEAHAARQTAKKSSSFSGSGGSPQLELPLNGRRDT